MPTTALTPACEISIPRPQTLQATRDPRRVLEQLVRIGRHAIISFPNFGHWRVRLRLLLGGRMPVTHSLPVAWYETPNIHLCTIQDFVELARACGLRIDRALALDERGCPLRIQRLGLANLWAQHGLFLLSKK